MKCSARPPNARQSGKKNKQIFTQWNLPIPKCIHKQGVAKSLAIFWLLYCLFWPISVCESAVQQPEHCQTCPFCHPLVARRCDRIAASLCRDVDDSFSVFRRWFFDLFTIDSTADGASGVTNTLDAVASSALLTEWWHGVHEP